MGLFGMRASTAGWLSGKYEPFAIIGRGGMAELYLAIAHGPMGFNKIVVVKRLREELAIDSTMQMLIDEAKLAARLSHSNIVQTFEIGEERGSYFIVMEFLEGQSLRSIITSCEGTRETVPLPTTLRVVHDALLGLHYAHELADYDGRPAGIVHRDVSPHNVFVTYEGVTKLVDFGIAKAAFNRAETGTGMLKGKVGYFSPEQANGDPLDRRSDIFSIGIVLWELLSGRRLFPGELGSFNKLLNQPAPLLRKAAPETPPELEALVAKALELKPDARFQTAEAMRAELDRIASKCGGMESVPDLARFMTKKFSTERAAIRTRIESELAQTKRIERPLDSVGSLPVIMMGARSGSASGVGTDEATRSASNLSRRRRKRLATYGAAIAGLCVALGAFIFLGRGWVRGTLSPVTSASHADDGAPVRGVTDTQITMGMSAAFSGPSKELGRGMKVGIETSFDETNDEGGVFGRRLVLVTRDDGYEPDRVVPAMQELIEQEKVFAVIGNVGTPTAQVAAPYAVSQKTLFYGAFSGASLLRHDPPDRYVINYRASYIEETIKAVVYMVDQLRFPPGSIVAFTQNDAFGDAGFEGISKGLHRFGVDKSAILHVRYERNTSNVEDAVNQVLAYQRGAGAGNVKHPVKGIIMVGTYRPLAKFVRLIRDAGVDALFDAVSFVGSDAFTDEFQQLGAKYGDGVVVTQVVPLPRSAATAAIAYRASLKKYFPDERPGFVSFEGYLAAKVFVEALKRAGKKPNTESLVEAFESIHNLDIGSGGPITFGPSEHQGSHKVWGTVIDSNLNYQILDME